VPFGNFPKQLAILFAVSFMRAATFAGFFANTAAVGP
jgi:hypothetical protein